MRLMGGKWAAGGPPAMDWSWGAAMVAATTLYYVIGPAVPSLIMLAVLAVLCWRRIGLAITLIPLSVPFYLVPKSLHAGRRSLDFSLGETVILLCAAVLAAQLLLASARRPERVGLLRYWLPETPFFRPALLFLAAATLATAAARFHTTALREYREVVLEPLLFFWMVSQRLRGPADAVRLILALIGAGVVVAAMGVVEILFRANDLVVAANEGGAVQHLVQAVFKDQNSLALVLDRALPAALALVLLPGWAALWAKRDRVIEITRAVQGCLLAASALLLYVLYRTGSRGGEATTAVCLGLLFLYWQRRRPWVIAAGAVFVAVAALLERHRLHDFLTNGHGLSNLAHTSIWHSALNMIRDHPVVGVGPDNFLYYYTNDDHCVPGQPHHLAHYYYVQAGSNFERCISHPHNLFLDFWLSTGVIGLVAALWLIVLFAGLGLRAWRIAPAEWKGSITAVLLIMIAMVLHGEVDNSYFLPDLAVFFWLCLG
ncbi:MAG: O-antigen ligase family protein, partial [Chloroflexota bacterium]